VKPLIIVSMLAALVATLATVHASPAPDVTALGKATNDVANQPLGNFHYIKTSLRQGTKPEFLFIGTLGKPYIDAERFPVVKALGEFGTFSRVSVWPRQSRFPVYYTFPGLNLVHTVYRSRYISFSDRDLLDFHLRPLARLTAAERALFNRYANPYPRLDPYTAVQRVTRVPGGYRTDPLPCCSSRGLPASAEELPLVAIGGYAQTFPSDPVFADEFDDASLVPTPTLCPTSTCGSINPGLPFASFSKVQQSLIADRAATGLQPTLLPSVNAETNIIAALICHVDGRKPTGVCGRPVIRKLLKSVK